MLRTKRGRFMANLVNEVAQRYHVEPRELTSISRVQHIAAARQVACYVTRELTSLSYPAIGDYFNRHHSTVIHACEAVERRMREHPEYASRIEQLIIRMAAEIDKQAA